jgi:anti-sigma-K factor RskA
MRGQASAAASIGQVFFSPARGIVLTASRTTRLAPNQTYQLWATTNRGAISLGFIEPDAQGQMDAAFAPPPELSANIIGFMVTIEPTGGSERPSGAIALTS